MKVYHSLILNANIGAGKSDEIMSDVGIDT
jgi:hypothetical protein